MWAPIEPCILLAPLPWGGFVVAWLADDPYEYELVYGRRFTVGPLLFEDGFETGDTSAWPVVVP